MSYWLCGLALLCGTAAQAQELVDYDALFRDHAEQVVRSTDGTETLELPPGIIITRTPDSLIAMDQTGEGAVQCVLGILGQLRAVAKQCPQLGQDHLPGLEQNFSQVLRFAAENAYPPQDVNALIAAYDKAFSQQPDAADCADIAQDPDILGMMAALARPDVANDMTKTPRLPVMNPCL
jgi:hypothetical protein